MSIENLNREQVFAWYKATFPINGALAIGHGKTRLQAIRACLEDVKIINRLQVELA